MKRTGRIQEAIAGKRCAAQVRLALLATLAALMTFASASAQDEPSPNVLEPEAIQPAVEPEEPLTLTAEYQLEENTQTGYLVLNAKILPGSYIMSLTQQDSPTRIDIAASDLFSVEGKFQPDRQPTIVEEDPVLGVRCEKHTESLRFFVPLTLLNSVNPEELTIRLRFNGQVCAGDHTCHLISDKILEAKFSGYFQRVAENPEPTGATMHR